VNEFDVIIIGAGPAGDFAAALAAEEHLEVALIERERVGGECAYWACMPSKALLRPGQLQLENRRVPGMPTGELDVAAVLARRDEATDGGDDTTHAERQESRGITILRGRGRLDGERRVRLERSDGTVETVTARRAVILSVGSGADIPPIPGLSELSPWTNREATTAARVPSSLIVLGGGAVGCELAQAWASLGTAVTLVESAPQVLPSNESFAGDLVAAGLGDLGVDVRAGTQAVEAGHAGDGGFALTLDSGDTITAEELLVCIGRTPHTGDLGLESVDLAPGELITVDDQMRVPRHGTWLYAVGDVNGRALLTHAGKYQALIAIATIMNRPARADWDGPLTPQVVFTEPQVASVGQTLEQALAAGITARAVDDDPGQTPGGSFTGQGGHSGARIVVDTDREVMIGATFVGPEIAEFLHAATIAIVGQVPLRTLAHAIPAYPTRSEMWLGLLMDWRA
jgi:pyruvate/2-oxoglutarate dehydrogenase complex dihydrolipoamide dehydrogenase (E3) component